MTNPKISIIITCYQRLDFSRNLISSILDYTNYDNYEIIAVNSWPKYNVRLDSYLNSLSQNNKKVKYVCDGKLQYMEANEKGYLVSDGDYIQLLNDDTLIPIDQKNWLSILKAYLDSNPKCASVSPYQYLDGIKLYTMGETDLNKPGHTCGRFKFRPFQLVKEKKVRWNNFSCVMMKRDYIEKNRFLDVVPKEQYHYGSDSCYCGKIIENGFDNILINSAWIYHFNNRNYRARHGKFIYTNQ